MQNSEYSREDSAQIWSYSLRGQQNKFLFNMQSVCSSTLPNGLPDKIILFSVIWSYFLKLFINLRAPRYFRGNLNSIGTISFLISCYLLPPTTLSTAISCCIISKLKDCPDPLLSIVLAANSGLKDCTKTKKNCLFFRTVYITGDLQLGLHITSIILFTLLLVSSKTALNDLSIYVCTSCTSTNDMQTLFLIAYGKKQINFAVIMFLLCEAGNFSIHVALSDLRRNGSKTCKIPYPTKNPFTWLFFFVSCPNYTYEDKVILINRDINANAVTRNIFNFLGQNRWGPGSVSLS
uniref:3-oxo-5-alpha-steroid 4-dehydrogenase C-terminal domain-containing protein n=1 Tax=Zonotrichia albicollis TaxID=44394 RepID=A0A8D2MK19_ZONAL